MNWRSTSSETGQARPPPGILSACLIASMAKPADWSCRCQRWLWKNGLQTNAPPAKSAAAKSRVSSLARRKRAIPAKARDRTKTMLWAARALPPRSMIGMAARLCGRSRSLRPYASGWPRKTGGARGFWRVDAEWTFQAISQVLNSVSV